MNYKILIASISILVFGIIGFCLWKGVTLQERTVVEHPYEDGLKYEAMQQKYALLGWKVTLPPSLTRDGELQVTVADRSGAAIDPGRVEFALEHLGGSETHSYRASRANRGRYAARIHLASPGYWDVKVKIDRGEEILRYDGRIHIER